MDNNNNTVYYEAKKTFFTKKKIGIIIAAIIVLAIIVGAFTTVKPGHTGVVVTLGKVSNNVLTEGLHLKVPFIQNVVQIDNRIVKLEVETEAFSKDLQTVSTVLAINYRVESDMSYSVYKNIGSNYESVLVVPAVNEALKAENALLWVQEMNNCKAAAEEIVLQEVVYQ